MSLCRGNRVARLHNPTAPSVGPGSYDAMTIFQRDTRNSSAPFGSTSREVDSHNTTPGPCAYNINRDPHDAKGVFLGGKSPRLVADTILAKDFTPGPGAYFKKSRARLKLSKEKPQVQKKLNWAKSVHPPSIPVNSFGYEEVDGKWEKAPSPEPPEWPPSKPPARARNAIKGAMLSCSGQQHSGFDVPQSVSEAPGPGAYDTKSYLANGVGDEVSSAFRTTSGRSSWRSGARPEDPGPGWYNLPQRKVPTQAATQVFGSCKQRTLFRVPLPDVNLGPGEYDVKNSISDGVKAKETKYKGTAKPLGSNLERFPKLKEATPGPGFYDTSYAEVGRVEASCVLRTMFGTTAARFPEIVREGGVGPGTYDVREICSTVRNKEKRNAVFVEPKHESKGPPPPPDTSPPLQSWSKPEVVKTTFGTASRFPPPPELKKCNPLSAAVALARPPTRFAYLSTPRFPDICDKTPAPNQYNVALPLLKRTYNITL